MCNSFYHRSPFAVALVALLTASVGPALGQSFWLPGTDGSYQDPANWSAGVPNAAGAWAAFGQQSGNTTRVITSSGAVTVGRLSYTSGFNYTLTGGTMSLNNGATAVLFEKDGVNATGNATINTPLTINGAANALNINYVNGASGNLTIASLTGSEASVNVNALNGLVTLTAGSYGGVGSVTTVSNGVLRANETSGLPFNTRLVLNSTQATGAFWEVTQATTVGRSVGVTTGDIQVLGALAGFSTTSSTAPFRFELNSFTFSEVQWGTTGFNPTILQFGRGASASGTETYIFDTPLNLNGATRSVRAGPRAVVQFNQPISTSTGTAGLTLSGLGVVELAAANTYNGTTTVGPGSVLRAVSGAGLPTTSNLVLNSGVLENRGGATTFSRSLGTAAGQVRVQGDGAGFAAFGGTHTIRLNNGTGTVTWGSADFMPTGNILQFGSPTADTLVDFQNGIDLNGGTRIIRTLNNGGSPNDMARISGVISGSGVLALGGNGFLDLTAVNTYTGNTAIFDSTQFPGTTVRLNGTASFAQSPLVTIGIGRTLEVAGLSGGANFSSAFNGFQIASGQTLAGNGTVIGPVRAGIGGSIRGGSPASDGTGEPTTGQLRATGGIQVAGTLIVDINGTTTSGTMVSRIHNASSTNTIDFDTSNGPVVISLVNTSGLQAQSPYSFLIASSAGGFSRNGTPVTSYDYGTDYILSATGIGANDFLPSTLNVADGNLTVTFVPTPEPGGLLAVAAAAVGAIGWVRRRRFV